VNLVDGLDARGSSASGGPNKIIKNSPL